MSKDKDGDELMEVTKELYNMEAVSEEVNTGLIRNYDRVNWRNRKEIEKVKYEAKYRKTIVARMKACGRNSGRLGEARQREREMGIEIAQLQHVNELCYVIECEDISDAFVKKLENTAGGMKVTKKG